MTGAPGLPGNFEMISYLGFQLMVFALCYRHSEEEPETAAHTAFLNLNSDWLSCRLSSHQSESQPAPNDAHLSVFFKLVVGRGCPCVPLTRKVWSRCFIPSQKACDKFAATPTYAGDSLGVLATGQASNQPTSQPNPQPEHDARPALRPGDRSLVARTRVCIVGLELAGCPVTTPERHPCNDNAVVRTTHETTRTQGCHRHGWEQTMAPVPASWDSESMRTGRRFPRAGGDSHGRHGDGG
ncbi:uncharacterized protein B0I36DRAFT_349114 [Microdochium trichocladiopsis]|uniref:Uncharacterized protein n=1 Tax=Microdochium trichocladiopsis TaxID=1682393 RepID=A0A9P8Y633_9PEZI|nr:uncharacterized protein B0I36DRAFT_349114 [Microdochium trichocladiopsis]KAH7030954.1 hypothetical protein B0I36DRAFT_349114 [Microdochium trichocladiopsis]